MNKWEFRRYRKRTKYDLEKSKKMNNFTYLNKNACRENQIVLAGDSITELFNMELFDDFCDKHGVKIYNRGISGDTSDRLLERLEENVISIKPKAVVILIGINDLTAGANPEYIAENIRKAVEAIKSSNPNTAVILEAVFPVNTKMNHYRTLNKARLQIGRLNNLINNLAEEYGAELIDLTDKLSDSEGMFRRELTYDGLHPNAQGFSVAAQAITEKL
ncbi:MAG: SGNH/GDSL hydrolase family protein [Eubacterium sp.]